MAVALGLFSHVPGGLGVFEAVMLLACGGRAPPEQIIGALCSVSRHLLPAAADAGRHAARRLRVALRRRRADRSRCGAISPLLLATLTFIAGAWLLVSGVTPLSGEATDLLAMHVPLPLVEASHFIGSVAGFAHARCRTRSAASARRRLVGRVPAGGGRCRAGDAEGHRAVRRPHISLCSRSCCSLRDASSIGARRCSRRRSSWAWLAVDRVGRRDLRADPVLRLPGGPVRPRAVVGVRVRRQRAARRCAR